MMKHILLIFILLLTSHSLQAQDLRLGIPVGHLKNSVLNSVTFSSDGKTIITSSSDNFTYCWDSQNGRNYYQLVGHSACAHESIYSHNEKYIATRSCDKKIILWDRSSGDYIREFNAETPIHFFF